MRLNNRIYMEDCLLMGNQIFFFSKEWNALYVTDLELRKTNFIGRIPEEWILAKRLCAGIAYCKGRLVLVPMAARKIWIYDLKEGQWTGIERKYVNSAERQKEIFRTIEYNNHLFFVGSNYPAIIRMNMDTYELDYLEDPYLFQKPYKKDQECYFRSDFSLNKNELYIASCLNNYVLGVNLDTFHFKWYEVGEAGYRYSGIVWDGINYWLSPRKGTPIVKWDGKDKIECFPLPEEFDDNINNFLGVQYHEGKIIFPGMLQNKTVTIESCVPHNMNIYQGQYTFYRCSEEIGVLSQTIEGLFSWKCPLKNKEIEMFCEIQEEQLIAYLTSENNKKYNKNISDEIWKESLAAALPLYFLSLKAEILIENKKTKNGVNIWENIRN